MRESRLRAEVITARKMFGKEAPARYPSEPSPFTIVPQQLALAEELLRLSAQLRAGTISRAAHLSEVTGMSKFLDPSWAPATVQLAAVLQCHRQLSATDSPSRRLQSSRPPPDAECSLMLRVLEQHLPSRDQWVQKARSNGLGRVPVVREVFDSEEELHSNFRVLCKFGEAAAVKEICAGAPWFINKGSVKYNETGLILAAKYGQQAVVVELLAAGAAVNYMSNGGRTALMWACCSFSQQNFSQREAELAGTVVILMQADADVNIEGCPKLRALNFAVQRDSESLVALLVAGGGLLGTQDEVAEEKFQSIMQKRQSREEAAKTVLVQRSVSLWLCLQKCSGLPAALIEEIVEWVWAEDGYGVRFRMHRK